jgi:sn-glycerol 3-phosphate transport system permease protein
MATRSDPLTPVGSRVRGLGAPRTEHPGRRGRAAKNAAWYVGLSVLSVIVLFPIYMTLIRALSAPLAYVTSGQPLYPVEPEWDVFSRAFSQGDLGRHLFISGVVTLVITAGQLVTSVLAAYAFAFLRFPLKKPMFVVFIATLMLPVEVTVIANVRTIRDLDWLNSIQGLTVPFLATAFGTFLIRQGFLAIPRDLRDASKLDGFGDLAFLWRVAIPLTKPIIASFTLIAFLGAWNQYLWPRAVTTEQRWATVQIALQQVAAQNIDETNIGFAAAIIAAIPILILLILFQKQLIRGLTAGAVKG